MLRRCKELWDRLIVWVSTDEFNILKGKTSIIPYNQRLEIVKSIKYVDLVISENDWEQKENDLIKYNAQLVMGDDRKWKFDDLECVYLPRTEWISTTQIKNFIWKIK